MNKTKNFDLKKFLLDNAIIVILLLMALYVGITKDNFFTWNNFSNVSINTALRFIIALGVSGCLITKGTDLSAGRIVGLGGFLQFPEPCCRRQTIPTSFSQGLGNVPVVAALLIALSGDLCHLRMPERLGNLLFPGTAVHHHPGYADYRIWYLPGVHLVHPRWAASKKSFTNVASGKLLGIPYFFFVIAFVIGFGMRGSCTTTQDTANTCMPSAVMRTQLRYPVST